MSEIGSSRLSMSDVVRTAASVLGTSVWSLREAFALVPRPMVVTLVSSLAQALAPAAQVLVVGWLVGRSATLESAALPILALVLLIGSTMVLASVDSLISQRARLRVARAMQESLVDRIARVPPQRRGDPALTARIELCRNELYVISEQAGSVVSSLAAAVTFVSLCAALWPISPWAGIAVALALLPNLVSFSWAAAMQQREWPKVSQIQRRVTYLLEQLVQQRTGTEISANGSGPRVATLVAGHQRRADEVHDRILAGLQKGTVIGGVLSALLLAVALVLIVAAGGGSGGVAAGVLGVLSGIQATRGSGFSLGLVQQGSPKVQVYRDLIDELPLDDPLPVIGRVDALEVADVTVRYPSSDRTALVGADLTVRRGEVVALVGSNGAGKTTLVNAIMGSVARGSGRITIDGVDTSSMSTAQLTAHFGLLTQEFGRYELTVRQALSLGVPGTVDVPDESLWAALRTAHLDGVVADLPDGLDTQIGEQFDGVGLSGGQWQRLALARTALRGAAIWILDEPTSAVDAETEREIFAELLSARADRITIVVSHRAWTLRGMDRILVLDHGRIVQAGRYEELASQPGRFAELFAEE